MIMVGKKVVRSLRIDHHILKKINNSSLEIVDAVMQCCLYYSMIISTYITDLSRKSSNNPNSGIY